MSSSEKYDIFFNDFPMLLSGVGVRLCHQGGGGPVFFTQRSSPRNLRAEMIKLKIKTSRRLTRETSGANIRQERNQGIGALLTLPLCA